MSKTTTIRLFTINMYSIILNVSCKLLNFLLISFTILIVTVALGTEPPRVIFHTHKTIYHLFIITISHQIPSPIVTDTCHLPRPIITDTCHLCTTKSLRRLPLLIITGTHHLLPLTTIGTHLHPLSTVTDIHHLPLPTITDACYLPPIITTITTYDHKSRVIITPYIIINHIPYLLSV